PEGHQGAPDRPERRTSAADREAPDAQPTPARAPADHAGHAAVHLRGGGVPDPGPYAAAGAASPADPDPEAQCLGGPSGDGLVVAQTGRHGPEFLSGLGDRKSTRLNSSHVS